MRKAPILLFVVCLQVSCLEADWTTAQRRPMTETIEPKVHGHVEEEAPVLSEEDTIFYFSGVRFPGDYDWSKDTALGNGEAEVYLLENWFRKASFKSGYANCVSPDPDTHHLINGNLYTEFSTVSETVIKRNGEELFRYPGREKIDWMIVDSVNIYTLGKNRGGEGFSFRKNGTAILERTTGSILRGLHSDSGHLYFFYRKTAAGMTAWYMVEDGMECQLQLPEYEGELKDLIVWNGEVHILSSSGYGFSVISNKWTYKGQMFGNYTFKDAHFVATDNGPYVCGAGDRYGTYTKALFMVAPDGSGKFFDNSGGTIYYNEGHFSACWDTGDKSVFFYFDSGRVSALEGVRLFGGNCVDFKRGILAVGLSSTDHRIYPKAWINEEVKILEYHGYLTGAEIILPRSESSNHQN